MNEDFRRFLGECDKNSIIIHKAFETPRVGQWVDNGMGVEFGLSKYAVFYEGEYDGLFKAEEESGVDVMPFQNEGIGVGLAQELHDVDGYEQFYEITK